MNLYSFLLFIALVSCLICNSVSEKKFSIRTFEEFKRIFKKKYENSNVEALRKIHFEASIKQIKNIFHKYPTVDLDVNEYSDLSLEEFENMFHVRKHESSIYDVDDYNSIKIISKASPLPNAFDWREKIYFSPIITQGPKCGSCWAFAVTAAVESIYAQKKHLNLVLSKQEIVDCSEKAFDSHYRNHGCYFGYDTDAYKYIYEHGVMEEKNYPYTANFNESCRRDKINSHRFKIDSYIQMPFNQNDEVLKRLIVEKGPISVNVHGTSDVFRHYHGGILRNVERNTKNTNHLILLVGYNRDESSKIDYWIARNSWGTNWGEGGYVRIERGYNQLGINNFVAYPILN